MFETSKDILYLVIAFCILLITFFMCWLLCYFISIIGSVRKVIKGLQDKIDKLDDLIKILKEKVEHSATYLAMIMQGVGKLVEYFKDRKSKEGGRKAAKN